MLIFNLVITNFSFKLNYNEIAGGVTPQYNGNISRQQWGEGATLNNSYTYTYDKLNRLKQGIHSNNINNEKNIYYDKVGNILSLTRDNTTQTYMYEGNRLKTFNNGIQRTYLYNANGSMVKDGIVNISYYENGMPKSINKSATEQVYYTFDAMGNKLRTNYYNKDSLYYYNDGIEYKGTVNPKLYYIATEDGYIDSTLQYNYYLKDHLGNIRKVLNATTRTVTQSTNYYPFGLAITTTGTSKNKYLYNGKELQPSNAYYDYGARMYDASVGRWFVVDPLAEKFIGLNAYVYCANNPILLADPNGKDWSISASQNKEGNWTINIHFKAQILNSSGEKVDTKALAEATKSQFENAFNNIFKNDDGTTITVNASANISVINKKEDLAKDATLIDIRNKNDEIFKNINSNITAGVALNGKEILLNESQVNSFINGENKRTIPHEIGHTAGLNHPSSDIEQIIPRQIPYIGDPKGNLMNQGIHQISPYNDKIFTFPTKGQINRIYSLYSNGYLNTNKSTIKVPTPFQINKF